MPTEAQWEYACRARTTTEYSCDGGEINYYMWYSDNSNGTTHEVGTKRPNPWGLYDMHGNVFEWCLDWYGAIYCRDESAESDPTGPSAGDSRVLRGGGWYYGAQYCRSAYRNCAIPDFAYNFYGFRVVFVP